MGGAAELALGSGEGDLAEGSEEGEEGERMTARGGQRGKKISRWAYTDGSCLHHVRLAYQPPASSTFLSEQTSHQQPANSTFLSEQTSISHQPPAKQTGC
jgi:hypothetical protein